VDEPEIVSGQSLTEVLARAASQRMPCELSLLSRGKWHKTGAAIVTATDQAIHVELPNGRDAQPIHLQINQPVGLSLQHEYNRYIFETVVLGLETSVNHCAGGRVILERPEKMERLQRRAYQRVSVPAGLNIKVLFWHRGYTDDWTEAPLENYWQGRLVNLSAGGAYVTVESDQRVNFRIRQVLGLQFTPMPHEKPILLEAQVIHLQEDAETGTLNIGAEFLGLEAAGEPRQKLHRLREIVEKYDDENNHRPADSAVNSQ